jgi:hypothetical protein
MIFCHLYLLLFSLYYCVVLGSNWPSLVPVKHIDTLIELKRFIIAHVGKNLLRCYLHYCNT